VKSRVYFSPNTKDSQIDKICNILGMESTDDLGRYLGVPTINGRVTRAQYQYVLERLDKRLAGWKTTCLSLAGRATLVQSTLAAILTYTMQTTRLPRSVCDDIDRKVRRFFVGRYHYFPESSSCQVEYCYQTKGTWWPGSSCNAPIEFRLFS